MSILNKQCVGCGIEFTYFEAADTSYCTSTCEDTHSLLPENGEETKEDVRVSEDQITLAL